MRILLEAAKRISAAINSNAGSQMAGAIAGSATTGLFAYILGKGERERELDETRAKVIELETQLKNTNTALNDCQTRNTKHIEREVKDAQKIGKLRLQYNLCQVNNTLVKSAFKSSYCFIRSPIPDNIESPDSDNEANANRRPLQ